MSTIYSRYFSALARYQNGDPIDDRDFDGEFDAMTVALNRKVLCSGTAPTSPINGQTWSDTTQGALKLYKVNAWATMAIAANASIVTSDTVLTAADSQNTYVNTGAGALVTFTLPTAATNLTYTFYVQNVNGIKVVAAAGDTIRIFDQVTKDTGYIDSVDVGSIITLVAVNNAEWIAFKCIGKWELEIS